MCFSMETLLLTDEFVSLNASQVVSVSVMPSGLCPDWETWDPSQPVENAREAMQQADDWLGVPQVTITCSVSCYKENIYHL